MKLMPSYFPLMIFGAFLFSGCSALRNNVVVEEPTLGPLARVRIVIPDISYRGVRAYPLHSCISQHIPGNGMVASSQMVLGFEKNLNGRKIDMPVSSYSDRKGFVSAEIFAAGGEPIAFRFMKPSTQLVNGPYVRVLPDGCGLGVTFVPKANEDYELTFGDEGRCEVNAVRLLLKNGIQEQEAIQVIPAADCNS